jgi:RNA polymerase sigma factor (sigma-70 family)
MAAISLNRTCLSIAKYRYLLGRFVFLTIPPQTAEMPMTTLEYYSRLSSNYPLLTPAEEQHLGRKGVKKSYKDKQKLILHNLRLAMKLAGDAHRRFKCNLEIDDFVSFAMEGLDKGAELFIAGKGSKFCTYTVDWIKQRIGRGVEKYGHLIRVPSHVTEKRYKIRRAVTKLIQTQQDMPTLGEVSRVTGIRPSQVLKYHNNIPAIAHLDAMIGDDSTASMGQFMADDTVEDPSIMAGRKDDYRTLHKAMGQLDERQCFVLRMRMGMGCESHSLDEVAIHLKVTRERTRQIEADAKRNLGRLLISLGVAERDPSFFEWGKNASLKWAKGRRPKVNRASSRLRERQAERNEDLRLLDRGVIDSLDGDDLSALA